MPGETLLMVGCGKMGSALLGRWLAAGAWRGEIVVVDHAPSLTPPMQAHHQVRYCETLEAVGGDVTPACVFLAVKPQGMADTLTQYQARFGLIPLYVTIAAGLTVGFYQAILGAQARLVRAMPNTPVLIGKGISALYASESITETDRARVTQMFRACGEAVWLKSESEMDPVTALSGSGPAYIYYIMECLIHAGIEAGLEEATARTLVMHTVQGSSELALFSKEPLEALRRNVTSPGGTTEAALSVLMRPGALQALLGEAVDLAIHRATQLSVAASKQQAQ